MWKWFLLACAIFCGINWFILPNFPYLAQYIRPLTIWSAIGLSGLLMVVALLFGKK
jgi:hypothetical protein